MARDGSGTMSILNGFASQTGETISSSEMDANFTDVADEITNSLALDGQSVMTGQLKAKSDGTAAAPSLTFGGDLNTGVYPKAADKLGFSTGGTERAFIDDTGKLTALFGLLISTLGLTITAGGQTITAGDLALSAGGISAINDALALSLRRSDTSGEQDFIKLLGGAGSGDAALIKGTCTATGLSDLTLALGGVDLFTLTSALFKHLVAVQHDSYLTLAEITAPSAPSDNQARLYAVEDGGTTKLAVKLESGGTEKIISTQDTAPGALIAILQHRPTAGTSAGTVGTNSRRTLDTLVYNRDTAVALSNSQFTPPAGDLEVSWFCIVGGGAATHQAVLWNVTQDELAGEGTGGKFTAADDNNDPKTAYSKGTAVITANGTDKYEIRHFGATSQGDAVSKSTHEVYAEVTIRRA